MEQTKTLTKQLAIIKNPRFGLRETHNVEPRLWFVVYLSESARFQLEFAGESLNKLISENHIIDIKSLDGKPCWVFNDGVNVKFASLMIIPEEK